MKSQNSSSLTEVDVNALENDLEQLRMQYNDMRKDRLKSQKDEQLLSNKMNLLSKEEIKVNKKQVNDSQYQDNLDKIRVGVLQEKELIDQLKRDRIEKLNDKKKAITQMKQGIDTTLKTWRENLVNQKLNKSKKVKNEKKNIQDIIQSNKEDTNIKNRHIRDKIQLSQIANEEKRKKEELEKKLRMKKEFEEKIKQELEEKAEIDKRINTYQEESMNIIERINTMNEFSVKNSKMKSYTSSSNTKAKNKDD